METSELRLGNWVHLPTKNGWGYDKTVKAIHVDEILIHTEFVKIHLFEPLEINHHWFRFYRFVEEGNKWVLDNCHLRVSDNVFHFYFNDNFITSMKYIHELQNLYFAVNGRELIIRGSNEDDRTY